MKMLAVKPLQTDHLRRLTDDTGIFQHTKFGLPDRTKGYTSDDNARALIAAVMLYKKQRDAGSLELIYTYMSFIHHAQNEDGSFRNIMDYNRLFIEDKGSEDCLGRCLWALGFALSEPSVPDNLQNTCRYMLNEALPHVRALTSPRAIAYAMIGLSYSLEPSGSLTYKFPYPYKEKNIAMANFLPRKAIETHIEDMALRLHKHYSDCKGKDWRWFEESITYSNAILPWALFRAYRLSGRADFLKTAKESLDFLASVTFCGDEYFQPVGCHGWLPRNGEAALFDQQPIEACEMLLACLEAYKVLKDESYLKNASDCLEWYRGRNSRNVSLLDPQTGGCYDGIHADGLNLNQGSESMISYCIAHTVMCDE